MAVLCMASMPWTRSDDYCKSMVDNWGFAGYQTAERIEPDGRDANYYMIWFNLWSDDRVQRWADAVKDAIYQGHKFNQEEMTLMTGLYRIKVEPNDYTMNQFISNP